MVANSADVMVNSLVRLKALVKRAGSIRTGSPGPINVVSGTSNHEGTFPLCVSWHHLLGPVPRLGPS